MLLETVALVRTSAPAAIRAKLDFGRVGFIGHSRGGEAVVMGALLAASRGLGFTVRCVGSIAPTDCVAREGEKASTIVTFSYPTVTFHGFDGCSWNAQTDELGYAFTYANMFGGEGSRLLAFSLDGDIALQ